MTPARRQAALLAAASVALTAIGAWLVRLARRINR